MWSNFPTCAIREQPAGLSSGDWGRADGRGDIPLGVPLAKQLAWSFAAARWGDVKIAAATVHPSPGSDLVPPRISGAMLGLAAPATSRPRRGIARAARRIQLSRNPRGRRSAGCATRAVAPVVFNGRIDPPGDEDQFVLAVTPGQRVRIKVNAYEHGSALMRCCACWATTARCSPTPMIRPFPCRQRAHSRSHSRFRTRRSISRYREARMRLRSSMRDLENRGGIGFPYRIVVEPFYPDFQLQVNESEMSVARGGTAAVNVTVQRRASAVRSRCRSSTRPRG